jgi:hypothetical protein
MNSKEEVGSLTVIRLDLAIDPCNHAVDKELNISDGRVHEGLGRKNKGLNDLAPVGVAPVAGKSISGSGHPRCKSDITYDLSVSLKDRSI